MLKAPVHNFFTGLLHGPANTKPGSTLPESVQFALSYRGAMLTPPEILALNQPEFFGLGVYLTAKALDPFPEVQWPFMAELAAHFSAGRAYKDTAQIAGHYLPLSETPVTLGHKVAMVIRAGPDLFERRFNALASSLYSGSETPVLIAYAGLLGFGPFMQQLPNGQALYVLNPDALLSGRLPFGYRFENFHGHIRMSELWEGPDIGSSPVTLVDDVRSTGATLESVALHLHDNPGFPRVAKLAHIASFGNDSRQ